MDLLVKSRLFPPVGALWILKDFLTCVCRGGVTGKPINEQLYSTYSTFAASFRTTCQKEKSTPLQFHSSNHSQILGHTYVVLAVSYGIFITYCLSFSKCNVS